MGYAAQTFRKRMKTIIPLAKNDIGQHGLTLLHYEPIVHRQTERNGAKLES